jgi:hypothetical protein
LGETTNKETQAMELINYTTNEVPQKQGNTTRPGARATAVELLAAHGIEVPQSWPLRKVRAMAAGLATIVRDTIETHERHRGAYFWRPNWSANLRRAAEFDVHHSVGTLHWRQYRSESARNVYYRLHVTRADGRKGNIGDLRKLLAALQRVNA